MCVSAWRGRSSSASAHTSSRTAWGLATPSAPTTPPSCSPPTLFSCCTFAALSPSSSVARLGGRLPPSSCCAASCCGFVILHIQVDILGVGYSFLFCHSFTLQRFLVSLYLLIIFGFFLSCCTLARGRPSSVAPSSCCIASSSGTSTSSGRGDGRALLFELCAASLRGWAARRGCVSDVKGATPRSSLVAQGRLRSPRPAVRAAGATARLAAARAGRRDAGSCGDL